jgi:hypothetical protein
MAEEKKQGSQGGNARRDALTVDQRKKIARKAAEARWGSEMPQATHDGPLQIGDEVLIAANLANGKRLISQGTFLRAIGRSPNPTAGTGGSGTLDGPPSFLAAEVLKPFISEELLVSTTPILFRMKNGSRTVGYDAMLLPMVCEVYLNFRDSLHEQMAHGDTQQKRQAKAFEKRYRHIINACDRLTRGLARRGIIALVDDATGYQGDRIAEEVGRLVIEAYVSPHLQPWTQKFPHEFFKEAYRLLGWEYKPGQIKHPGYMGKFINKFVYDALPPGVADELKKRLPKNEHGNRKAKLWQQLTVDTGNPHLDRQLNDDILLMRIADDKATFEASWDRAFGRQRFLPLQVLKQLKAGD